jgi:hypothetical protein
VTDTRSQQPQRWARCPPRLAWKRPGLPTDWVRVLKRHPEGAKGLSGAEHRPTENLLPGHRTLRRL